MFKVIIDKYDLVTIYFIFLGSGLYTLFVFPIRKTADLSIETLQAKKEGQDILKVKKEYNIQPRLLYPVRISFKYEGEIKSFTDKKKLREFSTIKPALQKMLKNLL